MEYLKSLAVSQIFRGSSGRTAEKYVSALRSCRRPHASESIVVCHLCTLQTVISGTARIKHTSATATRRAIAQRPQAGRILLPAICTSVTPTRMIVPIVGPLAAVKDVIAELEYGSFRNITTDKHTRPSYIMMIVQCIFSHLFMSKLAVIHQCEFSERSLLA